MRVIKYAGPRPRAVCNGSRKSPTGLVRDHQTSLHPYGMVLCPDCSKSVPITREWKLAVHTPAKAA